MKLSINAKHARICAFCVYSHDPGFKLIIPRPNHNNVWEFEKLAKALCLKYNILKHANASCSKFKSRV